MTQFETPLLKSGTFPSGRVIDEIRDFAPELQDIKLTKEPYLDAFRLVVDDNGNDATDRIDARIRVANKLRDGIIAAAISDETGKFHPPLPKPVSVLLQRSRRVLDEMGEIVYDPSGNRLQIDGLINRSIAMLSLVAYSGYVDGQST